MKFLNVYLIDQAYGGGEEGGWWYTYGLAVRSIAVPINEVARVKARLDRHCEAENSERRSDISSVLSEGRYECLVQREPAQDWPQESQHVAVLAGMHANAVFKRGQLLANSSKVNRSMNDGKNE